MRACSNRIESPHGGLCLLAAGLIYYGPQEGRCDDVGAELRDFTLRTWSKTDGLPDGSVTCIQQTQDGYLWVGTTAGLVRFDGIKFTPVFVSRVREKNRLFPLQPCARTRAGACGSGRGGTRSFFPGDNGQVRHYGTAEGLLDNDVTSLTLDGDGHLWIGTRSGVNRRNGDRFAAFTMREGLPNGFGFEPFTRRDQGDGLDHHGGGHVPVYERPNQPIPISDEREGASRRFPGGV